METRIKELREKADLTQEQLAVKAGLGSRTLSYIESGRDARYSTLRSIADVLGVSVAELVGEKP